jgi:copper chaperone
MFGAAVPPVLRSDAMETLELTIGGMSCQHCVRAVREALESVSGVTVSRVDVGHASLSFDAAQTAPSAIAAAVTDAGYDVRLPSA